MKNQWKFASKVDILPNIFKTGSFMNDGGTRSMKVEV